MHSTTARSFCWNWLTVKWTSGAATSICSAKRQPIAQFAQFITATSCRSPSSPIKTAMSTHWGSRTISCNAANYTKMISKSRGFNLIRRKISFWLPKMPKSRCFVSIGKMILFKTNSWSAIKLITTVRMALRLDLWTKKLRSWTRS